MLCGPGGVLGCCGKAGQLVESSWLRLESERMVMVVDGQAGQSAGCEEGVVAVLVLVLLWQQASEAGGGWSFSCRSRSKLQQTSGKALPMERKIDRKKGRQRER